MPTDHEAIQNLLAKYCFLTDRGTADDMAGLFWEDATVTFGDNTNAGIVAVKNGFAAWIAKMRDPVEGLRHVLHTPCIEIDGDSARAEAYYDADGHSKKKGRRIHLRGVYRDKLEKRDNEWRFVEKEIQIWRSMLEEEKT
jgi:hypothetical protein